MASQQAYYVALYKKHPDMLKQAPDMIIKLYEQFKHSSYDELRTITCADARYAYYFAASVDDCFHWETYQGVLGTKYEEYYLYLIGITDIKTKE